MSRTRAAEGVLELLPAGRVQPMAGNESAHLPRR